MLGKIKTNFGDRFQPILPKQSNITNSANQYYVDFYSSKNLTSNEESLRKGQKFQFYIDFDIEFENKEETKKVLLSTILAQLLGKNKTFPY